MKKNLIPCLLLLLVMVTTVIFLSHTKTEKKFTTLRPRQNPTAIVITPKTLFKIQTKASEAAAFVKKNKYNTEFCFLIDLSLPSNQKRFFIYHFKKDTVLNSGLVTHGNCNENWLQGRRYSNITGSGCSSTASIKLGLPIMENLDWLLSCMAWKLLTIRQWSATWFCTLIVVFRKQKLPATFAKVMDALRFHPIF
jgi:hypothetical protein